MAGLTTMMTTLTTIKKASEIKNFGARPTGRVTKRLLTELKQSAFGGVRGSNSIAAAVANLLLTFKRRFKFLADVSFSISVSSSCRSGASADEALCRAIGRSGGSRVQAREGPRSSKPSSGSSVDRFAGQAPPVPPPSLKKCRRGARAALPRARA
jgi:hypothetical protein